MVSRQTEVLMLSLRQDIIEVPLRRQENKSALSVEKYLFEEVLLNPIKHSCMSLMFPSSTKAMFPCQLLLCCHFSPASLWVIKKICLLLMCPLRRRSLDGTSAGRHLSRFTVKMLIIIYTNFIIITLSLLVLLSGLQEGAIQRGHSSETHGANSCFIEKSQSNMCLFQV